MILQFSTHEGRARGTGSVAIGCGALAIAEAHYAPTVCPDCQRKHALLASVKLARARVPTRVKRPAADALVEWLECYAAGLGLALVVLALEGDDLTQDALRGRGYKALRLLRLPGQNAMAFRKEQEH